MFHQGGPDLEMSVGVVEFWSIGVMECWGDGDRDGWGDGGCVSDFDFDCDPDPDFNFDFDGDCEFDSSATRLSQGIGRCRITKRRSEWR